MKKKTFQKEWVSLQHEIDAAWEDSSARKEGRSAWAIWRFAARCMTEVFAFVHALEDDARIGFSDEQFTQFLKEAEEDIARGVSKLVSTIRSPRILLPFGSYENQTDCVDDRRTRHFGKLGTCLDE